MYFNTFNQILSVECQKLHLNNLQQDKNNRVGCKIIYNCHDLQARFSGISKPLNTVESYDFLENLIKMISIQLTKVSKQFSPVATIGVNYIQAINYQILETLTIYQIISFKMSEPDKLKKYYEDNRIKLFSYEKQLEKFNTDNLLSTFEINEFNKHNYRYIIESTISNDCQLVNGKKDFTEYNGVFAFVTPDFLMKFLNEITQMELNSLNDATKSLDQQLKEINKLKQSTIDLTGAVGVILKDLYM